MDRSLVLKARQLARGTRPIEVLRGEPEMLEMLEDVIDADFVDVLDAETVTDLVVAMPRTVSPGRARRATDAYVAQSVDTRPVIVIA